VITLARLSIKRHIKADFTIYLDTDAHEGGQKAGALGLRDVNSRASLS
jgi:hypothetical protein